ncbi:hypothetical protein FACS189418_5360 [Clostridia bacterium]|nr:hypothetical protein FACS189418_5360 [Clostridia bacterium]
MRLLDKLEKKWGKYAISHLTRYVIFFYVIGLIISLFNPYFYVDYLALDAEKILRGQIWRIFTFIIYPIIPTSMTSMSFTDVFFNFMALRFYLWVGENLETAMGKFRYNLYVFSGFFVHTLAAIVVYLLFGGRFYLTNEYFNLSLFLAFALIYPDFTVSLFGIISMPTKWLALLDLLFVLGSMVFGGWAIRIAAAISLLNVLIFFFALKGSHLNLAQRNMRKILNKPNLAPAKETRHCCVICGRTEKDGDDLTFRYCIKCEGNLEYCQDHLYTHQHQTNEMNQTQTKEEVSKNQLETNETKTHLENLEDKQ